MAKQYDKQYVPISSKQWVDFKGADLNTTFGTSTNLLLSARPSTATYTSAATISR